MNIERMSQDANVFAKARVEQIETQRTVRAAEEIATEGLITQRNAQIYATLQAEEEYFESLRPQLEAQARVEHQKRFKPLQAMLNEFEAPVKEIRDMYFPDSKIAIADGYNGSNLYYRALLVLGKVNYPNEGQRLFGVYAVAIKPGGMDSSRDTIYRTNVSLTYEPEAIPIQPTEDMENITDESELFHVDRGEFYFGLGGVSNLYRISGKSIEFEMDSSGVLKIKEKTWDKSDPVERSFMHILETIELHDSLAQKGLPLRAYLL